MSRRTIIRPAVNDTIEAVRKAQRRQKLQAALEQERRTLARWQSRLRRSFNACEKSWTQYLLCHAIVTMPGPIWCEFQRSFDCSCLSRVGESARARSRDLFRVRLVGMGLRMVP